MLKTEIQKVSNKIGQRNIKFLKVIHYNGHRNIVEDEKKALKPTMHERHLMHIFNKTLRK